MKNGRNRILIDLIMDYVGRELLGIETTEYI
jgi:hypothetical protein